MAQSPDAENAPFITRDAPRGAGSGADGGAGGAGGTRNTTTTPRNAFESNGLAAMQPMMSTVAPNTALGIVFVAWWVLVLVADCIAIYYWQQYKNEHCDKNLSMMVGVFGIMQMFQILFLLAIIAVVVGVLGYAARHRMETLSSAMLGSIIALAVCFCCTALFVFCWLIVGSVWVYPATGVQKPTPDHKTCDPTLFVFAFWFVTAQWIGCGVCGLYYCITTIVFAARKPLTGARPA